MEDELIPEEELGSQAWYISWADMTTLLLTFFIVLLTFSTLSSKKFLQTQSSIQRAFGLPISEGLPLKADLDDRRAQVIQDRIDEEKLKGIRAQDFGDRVILTMDSGVAFGVGSAELTREGSHILRVLLPLLMDAPGVVRVEGHTCDLPLPPGSRYSDNWGLSCARAVSVLKTLVKAGLSPKKVAAAGYADQRPLLSNDSEANRARNRRVEFVIEKNMVPADDHPRGLPERSRFFDE